MLLAQTRLNHSDVKRGIAAVRVETHELGLDVELPDLGQDWLVLEKSVCAGRVLGVEGKDAEGAKPAGVGCGWAGPSGSAAASASVSSTRHLLPPAGRCGALLAASAT